MSTAAFYAPHRGVSSVTDAGGRLLGWTDANGNSLVRTGRGVNTAGGSINVFAYADAPNSATWACNQPKPQRPDANAAAARAADLAERAIAVPASTVTPERARPMTERQRDAVRAQMFRLPGAFPYKNPRLARELVERRPQDYIRDGWAREALVELIAKRPELESTRWARSFRAANAELRAP